MADGSTTEDTARYSVITGARLLSVEEIREHGRAARQHIANADAALARAGLSLREAERISDEVLGEKTSKPSGGAAGSSPASCTPGTEPPLGGEAVCAECRAYGHTTVCLRCSEEAADALISPPVDSPTSRAYCRCGCGSKVSAYNAALDYALLGLSATNAVENVACHYDLTELEQELMVEQIEEEVADRIRMGRVAP